MCIGAGYWACIRKGKKEEEDEVLANRPRSASCDSASGLARSDVQRKASTKIPCMVQLPTSKTPTGRSTLTLSEVENKTTPLSTYQNSNKHSQSNLLPLLDTFPTLKLPSPRFGESSAASLATSPGLQSPSQWTLLPGDDRPHTAGSSPSKTPSKPRLPRMASSDATSELSLTRLSPTPVAIIPSPAYAVSEYASIHRNSTRFSNLSMLSSLPPPPPPPPKSKARVPKLPAINTQSRPVSFRSFLTQVQDRAPSQTQQQYQIPIPPIPPTPISVETSSSGKTRQSRRTSLKSYIGRNGLGEEGIFVATSDDPDIPFTLFRWPNESSGGTPRSSKHWPK
ncbi:hypothetical protein P280DRAFT_101174 [Massarina eburnea CBS 473.64]|uniref:Uncharacterized protein n=1 Tax=Massarina eburnea CBS 473.64 TaxID=1395130 RepID=A0A6A6RPR2_9PLEO|nr:hypothetical protein P280DRAFT_101174 [Massarina eburnea CBS 473.64]